MRQYQQEEPSSHTFCPPINQSIMPHDANKRKAAKKKNKAKANKKSASNAHGHRHHHGESDRSQHNSPHLVVKTEKKENYLSGNESSTTEKTEKNVNEPQGETDTDRESNPQKPNEKKSTSRSNSLDNKSPSKKKSAVIEPASVADYLAQPIESSPQKGSPKVEDFKPIDHSLVEEQNDLVMNDLKNIQTTKESKVQKDLTISENNLLSDSRNVKCPYCGRRDDDGVKEPEPPVQCSEKQPLLDSTPRETKKSSWKSCCGICDLFSGSSR